MSERKLASVQIIEEILPIENADNLELAKILGWQVVVKKGQFIIGDKCVYCEIDSLLPEREEFEFLRKNCWNESSKGFRIKTIRLRGEISQGILFKLSDLNLDNDLDIDEDLTEILNIRKYERIFRNSGGFNSGKSCGTFHPRVPKTDETRIQSIYKKIMYNHINAECYVAIKLDGTSFTIVKESGEIKIYSRNFQIDFEKQSLYFDIFISFDIENKLKDFDNIALQGEIVGPGVNGNLQKLIEFDFYVFNIYDLNEMQYIEYDKMKTILEQIGLKMVPVINESLILNHTLNELLEMAEGECIISNAMREGIVVRDKNRKFSFKVISNTYLLKNNL